MKIRILLAILLAFCLPGCASYYGVLTPSSIQQIRVRETTEADLVALFGPPDTRSEAYYGARTQLDWYRSIPPEPAGYLPVIGQFFGGLDVEVQQLTVVLGHDRRVLSYRMYDSNGTVKAEKTRLRTRVDRDFRK